jgi:hypothetical protein
MGAIQSPGRAGVCDGKRDPYSSGTVGKQALAARLGAQLCVSRCIPGADRPASSNRSRASAQVYASPGHRARCPVAAKRMTRLHSA